MVDNGSVMVEETTATLVRANSAGEQIYVDEDEIHLGKRDPSSADADAVLAVAPQVESGEIDSIVIEDLELRHRQEAISGTNRLYIAERDSTYKQNTNSSTLQDCLDTVRGED